MQCFSILRSGGSEFEGLVKTRSSKENILSTPGCRVSFSGREAYRKGRGGGWHAGFFALKYEWGTSPTDVAIVAVAHALKYER